MEAAEVGLGFGGGFAAAAAGEDVTAEIDVPLHDGVFPDAVELFLCVQNRQYPIGHDDRITAQSNHDFGAFLTRVLHPD